MKLSTRLLFRTEFCALLLRLLTCFDSQLLIYLEYTRGNIAYLLKTAIWDLNNFNNKLVLLNSPFVETSTKEIKNEKHLHAEYIYKTIFKQQ
jgi:hypothetical protein